MVRALRRSLPDGRLTAEHLEISELSALEAGGISIGNHTYSHPILNRCSEKRVRSEIARSHRLLTEALASEPRAFAYPNGNYDSRAAEALKELGYEAAFLFDHRVAHLPPEDVFRISRVRVNSTTNLSRFKLIMSGLHPALHHAIGRS
jgi:peptidoglycan/xylan/chitin deacetylase (PgdA/CDA1 family)